jgi:hypothetical protein
MRRFHTSFHVAFITFSLLFWACINLRTPSAVQSPSTPLAALAAPKPEASPTLTRESLLAAQPRAIPALSHAGPAALYPSQEVTPGKADTLDVSDLTRRYTDNCPGHKQSCIYTEAHRNVPQQVHNHVYDEYNVPDSERNSRSGEVDHFWPLCAGGSNDISNL